MNALRHGERSDPEHHDEVMRALGEDPAQFEALREELRASFSPGDAFSERQVEDLTLLYWRRERLERMQTGLMRRALLEVEDRQHRRRKEIEGATFAAGESVQVTPNEPEDAAARWRLRLSLLGAIRAQVESRWFEPWHAATLKSFYGRKGGWRGVRLGHLLSVFANPDIAARLVDENGKLLSLPCEPTEVLWYKELLRLLEEEMASVAEEFEHEEKLNEERTAIERDACLAPSGEEWRMLLRREETLERAIDRKIKLLLSLRKRGTGTVAGAGGSAAELRSAPAEQGSADLVFRSAALRPGMGKAADLEPQVCATALPPATGNAADLEPQVCATPLAPVTGKAADLEPQVCATPAAAGDKAGAPFAVAQAEGGGGSRTGCPN